jgi:outer membrane protein TolC
MDRQYEVGVTGLLDAIDADAVLAASEVEVVAARADFLAAVARLELVYPGLDEPDGGLIP